MAFIEFAVCCFEGVVVEEVSVVDGDDCAGARCGEVNAGFAVGNDGVICVDQGYGDVGYVVPVGGEGGCGFGGWWIGEFRRSEARGEDQASGFSRGAEFVLCDNFSVDACDGLEGAGFEGNDECDGTGVGVEFLRAEGFAVEEELDLFGVGVDFDIFSVRGLVFFTSNMFGPSYIFGVEVAKAINPPASDIQSTPDLARKYNPVEPTPTTTEK